MKKLAKRKANVTKASMPISYYIFHPCIANIVRVAIQWPIQLIANSSRNTIG